VVTRLDRLARSTRDPLNVLDRLGKADLGFESLRETSVDTTSPQHQQRRHYGKQHLRRR
jgi:DNA invertase Pin-like site-specific DNA recombinase